MADSKCHPQVDTEIEVDSDSPLLEGKVVNADSDLREEAMLMDSADATPSEAFALFFDKKVSDLGLGVNLPDISSKVTGASTLEITIEGVGKFDVNIPDINDPLQTSFSNDFHTPESKRILSEIAEKYLPSIRNNPHPEEVKQRAGQAIVTAMIARGVRCHDRQLFGHAGALIPSADILVPGVGPEETPRLPMYQVSDGESLGFDKTNGFIPNVDQEVEMVINNTVW